MNIIEKVSLQLADDYKQCGSSETFSAVVKKYIDEIEKNESAAVFPSLPVDKIEAWINTSPLSFEDISGKIVLLDFFTYCCINCIHIIPFLHKIEAKFSVSDGLVVIGAHSAKFPNEKVTSNITHALKRYNIQHPVINDFSLDLWNELSIKCWPTLVVLSPQRKVLLSLPGETHTSVVEAFLSEALSYYKDSINNHVLSPLKKDFVDTEFNQLSFPGKIAIDSAGKQLAISDTGNNRIIVSTVEGNVQIVIGNGKTGNKDGDFKSCMFNSPQGVTWHGFNSIFVADCDNHLIRKIDLLVGRVVTVAGTGKQGFDTEGGKKGTDQEICSPWDLIVAGSPRFSKNKTILYIAMSGTHQIWAFFLEDADWQKGSEYEMGRCLRMAGNGEEENRNNSYPHKAGFAQPSGISADVSLNKLFVADSESSTVRQVKIANGSVEALVGGHFDPTNLFAFGDEDGKARNAKLQHPLGVAWDPKRSRLYVADSYNHKIKIVDPLSKFCSTLCGPEKCDPVDLFPIFDAVDLNEPGGLCLDPSCERLFVADTNNHEVKVIALSSGECCSLKIRFPSDQVVTDSVPIAEPTFRPLANRKRARVLRRGSEHVGSDSSLVFLFRVDDVRLTDEAPSSWQLSASFGTKASTDDQAILIKSGLFRSSNAEVCLTLPISDLLPHLLTSCGEKSDAESVDVQLSWEALLYFCLPDSQLCTMKEVVAVQPLTVDFTNPRLANLLNISIVFSAVE